MKFWRKINRVVYRFWHNGSSKGKVGYIGKDKYHPQRFNLEWRKRRKDFPKLYPALMKYPVKVWEKEILARGFKSDKAMEQAEILFIKKFDSKSKGYNCTDGGEGGKGRSPSIKTRKRTSRSMSGRVRTPEHCENIRKSKMGHSVSPETRSTISKKLKGRKISMSVRLRMSAAQQRRAQGAK